METNNEKKRDTLEKLAWQILTIAPLLKKRIFRPEIEQNDNALPLSYIQVLVALDESETMTVTEISSRFDIAKPNITPLIDRMIEAGYVKRIRNSADRRVVHVVIQEKGREKVRSIVGSLKGGISKWSGNIKEHDMVRLTDAISIIYNILKASE